MKLFYDKIKRFFVPFAATLMICFVYGYAQADNCLECHSGWEDDERAPSALFPTDVHSQAGLGCSDCHGGNPDLEDMDDVRRSKGYRGIPGPKEIPAFCATCHSDPNYMIKHNPALATDQFDKYKTSVHGQQLLGKGDIKVANCVSCHSVHDIASPQMPTSTVNALNIPKTCSKCHSDAAYMAGYGIPTDQFDDYVKSVHGHALLDKKDLGAPACNDCHGNHGATPPGITSISAVCGMCHTLISDEFAKSPHKKAFDEMGYPECEGCHSNHLVLEPQLYWVGITDSSLCVNCHSADDGTIALATADKMHNSLQALYNAYDSAETKTDDADTRGMMVTDQRFTLKEVSQAIIKTRTVIHSFNADEVEKTAAPGIQTADKVYQAAVAKIDEYYFRRYGLGIATLIITLLAVMLYFKIRSIEK
ncbi:MAG: cytochrome c3 family protein [Candidatus Zixiibacteriota bacterium]